MSGVEDTLKVAPRPGKDQGLRPSQRTRPVRVRGPRSEGFVILAVLLCWLAIGIAAAFGQRVDELATWNNLPRTAMLNPGQVIRVAPPPGVSAGTSESMVVRPAWPAYGQVARLTDAGNVKGIVITGQPNEVVKASADGNVIYVGTGIDQYKSLIVVKHAGDVVTGYAVNGDVIVKEGDVVKKGQQLAQMGTDASGRGTLEFEIRRAGKPVDPLALLPR